MAIRYALIVLMLFLFISCGNKNNDKKMDEGSVLKQNERGWIHEISHVGTYSSPRVADLNQDGTKDIVMGAGKFEFQQTDSAVVALSGKTGEVLWTVPARDQIFGSAVFLDVNRDGIPDVLIGGRSAVFMGIDGKTGAIIWEFLEENYQEDILPRDKGWYNFYNPQIIPDQTGDGIEDILISNGGDVLAPPHSKDRPPGKLVVINSSNGEILAHAEMPDGRETYFSPVAAKINPNDRDVTIVYGTGGETVGGSLYRTTLKDLMDQDISNSTKLANSVDKGFIAPPVLADITLDGTYDIICNAVEGKMIAIDGESNAILWENKIDNTEVYASLGVGHFTDDEIPDFATSLAKGTWPSFGKSVQIVINGQSGEIILQDSLGFGHTASPVVADLTGNNRDDILLSVNYGSVESQTNAFNNVLVIYDMSYKQKFQADDSNQGFNLASTPWVGDLNGNGMLDIVSAHLSNTQDSLAMSGFRIKRLKTNISLNSEVKWGAYMGDKYDGIYR